MDTLLNQDKLWLVAAGLLGLFVLREWYKSLPLAYHIRTIYTLVMSLAFEKPLERPESVTTWRGRVSICEMDWNMHKNNSNYALEIDIQRYQWFAALLKRKFGYYRKLRIANGGVHHFFVKEMRWGQQYEIRTWAAGCDRKWLYLRTEYVHPRTGVLFAAGLSRIVFKALSGETVAPATVLADLGFHLPAVQDPHAAFFLSTAEPGTEGHSVGGRYAQLFNAMVTPERLAANAAAAASKRGSKGKGKGKDSGSSSTTTSDDSSALDDPPHPHAE